MIKAVFFDYDGVLTPDKTGTYTTCRYIHGITGISIDKLSQCYRQFNKVLNTGKKTHKDIWPQFCECIGKSLDIQVLQDAFDSTPLNEAVFQLASRIGNKYKIGIITDNKKDRIIYLRKKQGLDKIFDSIIVSANVSCGKDDEKIFFHAAESVGVRPEDCVFIDNQKENLVVPAKIGYKTVFYDHEKNNIAALIKELQSIGVDI
ncbi:HAD-IA family hydrolase [Candidatus Woesearchaeota archaeon]|nr:HAD-IA family hydrolase [Candidatus Woesearchaeota archaeon]